MADCDCDRTVRRERFVGWLRRQGIAHADRRVPLLRSAFMAGGYAGYANERDRWERGTGLPRPASKTPAAPAAAPTREIADVADELAAPRRRLPEYLRRFRRL